VLFLDNPCNPTGTCIAAHELAALLDDLPPETLVVLDRAYYEFEPAATRFLEDLDRIRDGANLVVLRTFSKAHGIAGLRIGYAITRAEHARALDRVREAFNANAIGQAAALAALDDDEHLARTLETVGVERRWLSAPFDALGLEHVPSDTNFLFTNLGPRAVAVNEHLLARGIVIRPMSAPGIETWARISMGTREGNERLVAALAEALA
jgi:histidinol-phosphate aminotransferase